MSHTPGPWSVTGRVNNMIDIIHSNKAPGAITLALCRVQARQSWVKEAEANARLIAAAPELLESSQNMFLNIVEAMKTGGWVPTPLQQSFWDAVSELQAAISKATGADHD